MKTSILLLSLGLLASGTAALAEDRVTIGDVELSAGYEIENLDSQVPANNDPNAQTSASDGSRSGARLEAAFDGIDVDVFKKEPGKLKLRFARLRPTLDVSNFSEADGFGRVPSIKGDPSVVRRAIGVLVEGVYTPEKNGKLYVRTRLGSVEYDRDRGVWDWRVLDTAVGIKGIVKLEGGKHVLTFDANGGASGGILHLTKFREVQEALGVEPVMSSTPTINPYLAGSVSYEPRSKTYRFGLSTMAEQRLDLRFKDSRGEYLGNEINANSQHVVTALTAEMKLPLKTKKAQCKGFIRLQHEYDTLTLTNTLLNTGDGFQAFTALGGANCKF